MSDPDSSKPSDMVRVYVVEVAKKRDPAMVKLTKDDVEWWSRGTYNTPEEAGRHAMDERQHIGKDIVGVRVRQFWVQSVIPQLVAKAKATNVIVPEAPLVEFVCMDHPMERARATSAVKCPECKGVMVMLDFYNVVKEL